jgi:hypothetical protein
MTIRHTLIAAVLVAVLGGLIVPALAETLGGTETMPGQGMGMSHMGQGMSGGMMDNGMMSGGMMFGGNMGGCMGMMQSMNNGNGRPNSQWQRHMPSARSMPN